MTVNVVSANDPPVANPDTLAAAEDTAVTYVAADLVGNDDDGDPELDQPLTIASVESGTGGTAVLNQNGTVTFTPAAGFNGPASFSYTVSDGITASAPATVTVNVAAANDPPVADPDTLAAVEDTAVTYAAADLVGSDDDGDPELDQPLTIASVESGTGGTAVLNQNGTVTFTPAAGFNGPASFSYTVSDGITASAPATVTVNVAAAGLSITASTPAHLVEASSQGPGINDAVAALTLSGTNVAYDTEALLADGWTDGGNGNFIKTGQFGTAALNIDSNTLGYLLDNSKADKLGDNDVPIESFTVPVTDGANTASTIVDFAIEGRNDAPRPGISPELSFETGLSAWQILRLGLPGGGRHGRSLCRAGGHGLRFASRARGFPQHHPRNPRPDQQRPGRQQRADLRIGDRDGNLPPGRAGLQLRLAVRDRGLRSVSRLCVLLGQHRHGGEAVRRVPGG